MLSSKSIRLSLVITLTVGLPLLAQVLPANDRDLLQRKIQSELAFLRRAVSLSEEQEKRLNGLTLKDLESDRLDQRKVAPGVDFRLPQNRSTSSPVDALRLRRLERALEKQIDSLLSDDQKAKFAAEKASREIFRKEVALTGLVFLLSEKLALTSEQRVLIRESLSDWPELGKVEMEGFHPNKNYLPYLPDELILNRLDETQQKILKGTPRVQRERQLEDLVPESIQVEQ
jgi:hypothetical protein